MLSLVPTQDADHGVFSAMPSLRRVVVLGSTGSIGQSALTVIRQNPENLKLVGLVALGSKPELLAQQVLEHNPQHIVVLNADSAERVASLCGREISSTQEDVLALVTNPEVDIVLAGIVGVAGLDPVLAALEAGKVVALANKESLVVGGTLVRKVVSRVGPRLIPVDSEHSALFQAMLACYDEEISGLVLTASGGPFLRATPESLLTVTPAQAIKHPRWSMGPKTSVDSATLMNKALELIEAHYLFGVSSDKLSALIHPQSIVHAIVQLRDGSSLLQASKPDMKQPIAFALNYPRPRLTSVVAMLELASCRRLDFEEVNKQQFPAVSLALSCIEAGPSACIAINNANEFAVARFLEGRIRFIDIVPFVEQILSASAVVTIEDRFELDRFQEEIARLCDFVLPQFKLG